MKKGDYAWLFIIACLVLFLSLPDANQLFLALTQSHPYVSGFSKFLILATMGELLAIRIIKNKWEQPPGLIFRAVIWGFIGMLIVLMFEIYSAGIISAMAKGYLPGQGSKFAFAFLTSTILNLTFAPAFMGFHRITDTYIDLACREGKSRIDLATIINNIDWQNFLAFVVIKTIPIFWIPAHTITFLLPTEYRVLMAAFLSLALGAILSFAKRRNS